MICRNCDREISACQVTGAGRAVDDPQDYTGERVRTHYHHRAFAQDCPGAEPVR